MKNLVLCKAKSNSTTAKSTQCCVSDSRNCKRSLPRKNFRQLAMQESLCPRRNVHIFPMLIGVEKSSRHISARLNHYLPHQLVKLVFILLLSIQCNYFSRAQVIIGNQKNCLKEGQIMDIQGITDNPCITCYCETGYVQCMRERCPPPQCHVLIKRANQCCPACQECTVDGTIFQPSNEWKSFSSSPCHIYHCKNGIFTTTQVQCHTPCRNPLPPTDGECCPKCSGCNFNGINYSDGEEFRISTDPCLLCRCESGSVTCTKKSCPVLGCEKRRTRMSEDGCCLECVGNRYAFDLVSGECWFQRKILHPDEELVIDKCTTCVCKNGTVTCNKISCPATKQCLTEELIHKKEMCCPVCPDELLLNCTVRSKSVMSVTKRKHGEAWISLDEPCKQCTCNNGTAKCSDISCSSVSTTCPSGQVLTSVPGQCCDTCLPEPGVCTVFGDPHYRTFDGKPFNFQGDCKYVLAQDCLGRNFSILVQNDAKISRSFSWTKSVFLRLPTRDSIPEFEISLHQRLITKLNGRRVALPYITSHTVVKIEKGFVYVSTARGVGLKWDGDSYLEVTASPQYKGNLCGMCGNFNGFARDDFIGGDGLFKWDKVSFSESWRFGRNIFDCTRPSFDITEEEPCGKSVWSKLRSREKCSVFKSKNFHPCYKLVDPTDYYKSCLTDSCECPKRRKCSCESIRAYTSACERMGVTIPWNRKLYCKSTCQHGKVYSSCGLACKMTCRNYKNKKRNKRCKKRACVAGCRCRAGYVLHNKRCVKEETCSKRVLAKTDNSVHKIFKTKPNRRKPVPAT